MLVLSYIRKHCLKLAFIFSICVLSGLALYQEKQKTLMLDDQITSVREQITHTHAHIAMLHIEWSGENQPEHLADLVKKHAPYLHPSQINQFVNVAGLTKELPSVPRPILIARASQKRSLRPHTTVTVAQVTRPVEKKLPSPVTQPVQLALNNHQEEAHVPLAQARHYNHPSAITSWHRQKEGTFHGDEQQQEEFFISMSHKKKAKAKTAFQTFSTFGLHDKSDEYN